MSNRTRALAKAASTGSRGVPWISEHRAHPIPILDHGSKARVDEMVVASVDLAGPACVSSPGKARHRIRREELADNVDFPPRGEDSTSMSPRRAIASACS
jgi:hypothetical protein